MEKEIKKSEGKILPIKNFGTIDFSKITIGEEYQIPLEIQLFLIKNSLTSFMFQNSDFKNVDFKIIVERNNLSVIFNNK